MAMVNGTRVPVIGTVNMNCLAIDLTDVENATIDMTVILIGKDGDKEITVAGFS
jgi:alanine racemase